MEQLKFNLNWALMLYHGKTVKKKKIHLSDYFDIGFCVITFIITFRHNEIFYNTDISKPRSNKDIWILNPR